MKRKIKTDLVNWKNQDKHMPLLLKGARQVGKSFVVEQFGRDNFDNVVTIDFEFQRNFLSCFDDLEPIKIISKISAITKQEIIPEKTLLFLDEIQECPRAILSLRYFKEKMPDLHVVGAGSLLEFVLRDKDFHVPVGRIQSLYLKPLSFIEFLQASGNDRLITYIKNATIKTGIEAL